jgi:hypothetical protein
VGQRPQVDSVLILRDEAEADLDRDGGEERDDAQCPDRIMADADPFAAPVIGDRAGAANEARETRRRASDETPQQPEDQ